MFYTPCYRRNSALAGLPDCDLRKLQCVQNAAARLITRTKKHDHITPILIELHWLPVKQRILFKILCLIYRALNDSAPSYIQSLIKKQTPARSLRSSSRLTLVVPHANTLSYGERAFSRFAPSKFNKLPETLKSSATFEAFKSGLKTHLFKIAYPQL